MFLEDSFLNKVANSGRMCYKFPTCAILNQKGQEKEGHAKGNESEV
jgi:hypothetical protein